MAIRVLIADDHRLTLDAIKGTLAAEPGVNVIAEARSGREVLALVSRAAPDVALIDMHMPGAVDGLTCVERIRKRFPQVKAVTISAFTDDESVALALRRGAHAFISKGAHPRDIAPALRQVVEQTVFHAPRDSDDADPGPIKDLSQREVTVLTALAGGLSNRAISKELWVSEHTVKFHLTNIFRKIDVTNRTQAARWAHDRGLVSDPRPDDLEIEPAGELATATA
jgi:DNA-binding NarL/FixJ family response regulator